MPNAVMQEARMFEECTVRKQAPGRVDVDLLCAVL
jgi:hypothetical protein